MHVLSKHKLEIVRSVSSVESLTFYQHLCGTRRNAPVIKQHAFIDPFIVTSDSLNVENVRCALRRLREPRSWADQVIVFKPFYVVDGFWTGSHLKQKTARQWENFSSQRQMFGPKERTVLSSHEVIRWDITPLLAVWMLASVPTFTCNLTFSPSLTSTFSRGVTMVGLAPLLCLDGSFVTGDPGAAPVVLSVTSTDSENWETFKRAQSR